MSDYPTQSPTPESTPSQAAPSGRDRRGRFTAGNTEGAGNPFARQVAALRRLLLEAVTPEKLQEIVNALVAKAEAGDVPAAKLVLSYTLGRPAAAPDPDRDELHEWQIFKEQAQMARDVNSVCLAPEPRLYVELARGLRPVANQMAAEVIRNPHGPFPLRPACQEATSRDNPPSPSDANGKAAAAPSGARNGPPKRPDAGPGSIFDLPAGSPELLSVLGNLRNGASRHR